MQTACHKLDAATGPALLGIAKYEMAWLYKWIKNSSELIKSGDPQAKFMKKTTSSNVCFSSVVKC
jgi:hypothetical protein